MKIENFGNIKILVPSEGYKLTQKEDIAINERTISNKIALGKYDSYNNYKEVSNEEADIILKQIDDYYKSLEDNENNELK